MTQGLESELLAWFLTQEQTGPGRLSRVGKAQLFGDFCPGAGWLAEARGESASAHHGTSPAVWLWLVKLAASPNPGTSCMLGMEVQVVALKKCTV